MKYLTVILKCILVIFVLAALSLLGYNIYLKYPSGFELRTSKGPQLLTKLNALAEKGVPVNPDPYASSTYKPSDPLFEPVLAIQQGRWAEAKELLRPMAEQNNADALFWLAEITYKNNAFSGEVGARMFVKSAELGNPYAAMKLDKDNYDCQRRMYRYCDKKWGELGRKILRERADNGDMKAAFALIPHRWVATEEDHKKLEHIAFEAIKQNYYAPLVELINFYYGLSEEDLLFYNLDPTYDAQKPLLRKLALIAINNNYVPSIETIWADEEIDKNNEIILRYIPLSGNSLYGRSNINDYYIRKNKYNRESIIEGAAWSIVADHYENQGDLIPPEFLSRYRYLLTDKIDKPDLADSELKEAELLAERYLKISNPSIFIDEIEPRRGGY